jgi:CheY-like chemotaxis protein
LVNNVAQDIGMQCEVVSDLVTEGIRDPSLLATRESIVAEIRDLETSSRYLSAGVSDATLLHELLRIRSFSRQEDVLLNTVLDDLNSYAAHRRKRRGVAVRVEKHEHDKTTVSVTSREFLDTCLRGLLKECFASGDPGAEVVVRAFDDRESVAIEFSGFAAFDELGQDEEKPILAATQRFAELSGGKLYVFPGEAPYCSRFLLVLKRGAAVKKRTISHGRWALFVDDNPQVTGFYGRIAEAFSLPFMSASSVTEAVKILDTEGSPRFVMTDLQLGEESGLDLVRELRTRFGRDLVVIVISGNLSEEVRAAVQEVGATRFLAKPVGRSRLVAEFQGIMGER